MPQLILRRIAHRAVQVAILAAGILTIMLVFSRPAHAATSASTASAAGPAASSSSPLGPPGHLVCPCCGAGHLGRHRSDLRCYRFG